MYKNLIGKKVLIRSHDAGVYFGILTNVEGEAARLKNARNIWLWKGASCLFQIANDGITGGKVSPIVDSAVFNRVCQILPLTKKAIKNLEGQPIWKY